MSKFDATVRDLEIVTHLLNDMIFWQAVALRAMQDMVDRTGSAEYTVPVDKADIANDPEFQGMLSRVEVFEYRSHPGTRTVHMGSD